MRSKQLSQRIADDYRDSSLSVKQIARKHGVCVRTVYNIVGDQADRKGWKRQRKRYLALTREESETLLRAIDGPSSCLEPASPIHGIIERLNCIVQDLSCYER